MADVSPQPTSTLSKPSARFFSLRAVVLALVTLAVGIAVGLLLKKPAPPAPLVNSYSYAASQMQNFQLYGNGPGSRMSFQKPAEIPGKGSLTANQADPAHFITVNGKSYMATGISASAHKLDESIPADYLSKISSGMVKPTDSQDYHSATQPLRSFLRFRADKAYSTAVSDARSFTNDSIKSNAWQFDISSIKKNNTQDGKPAVYLGKVICVVGKHVVYFLGIISADQIWQDNQPTWQAIFNSLKIDQ